MPLSDDLEKLQFARSSRRSCLVKTILESLDSADKLALENALNNLNFSGAQISRILKENNIVIGSSTVNKHRKKDCCCHVAQ